MKMCICKHHNTEIHIYLTKALKKKKIHTDTAEDNAADNIIL